MARCYRNFWVSARTLPCSTILPALGLLGTDPKLGVHLLLAPSGVSLLSVSMVSLLTSAHPALRLQQVLSDTHAVMDQRNSVQRGVRSLISSLRPPVFHLVINTVRMGWGEGWSPSNESERTHPVLTQNMSLS